MEVGSAATEVTPVTQHSHLQYALVALYNGTKTMFNWIARNEQESTCAVICRQPFTINKRKRGKLFRTFFP